MPWLDDWGDEINRVRDGEDTDIETLVLTADESGDPDATPISGSITYIRARTTIKYRYVGMDYETATDCRDTMLDIAAGVVAHIVRSHEAGGFDVSVAETTYGAWEMV